MKMLLKVLLIILFIPIWIVLLPIVLIVSLLDAPFAKRRQKKLDESTVDLWLPSEKYVYVQYSSLEPIKSFVEANIVNNKHVVANQWNDKDFKWFDINWNKIDKRMEKIIISELAPDCEGLALFSAVGINSETKQFDRMNEIVVFGDTETGSYQIDDNELSEKEIKAKIKSHVKSLIDANKSS